MQGLIGSGEGDAGQQGGQAGGQLASQRGGGNSFSAAAACSGRPVQECSGAACTGLHPRAAQRTAAGEGRGECWGQREGKEAQSEETQGPAGSLGLARTGRVPAAAASVLVQGGPSRGQTAGAAVQLLQSVCSLVCSRGRRACCGTMAAADGISSPPASPAKELPTVSDILAAANMRRLLEAYRNLAPLTIGGPSSTSLETPGTPLSSRPPHTFPDPRLLRKFAHYPWLLGAQGMPPGLSPALLAKSEDAVRRRHASCDSMVPGGRTGQRLSPSAPVFSSKDRESSRY